jgi:hypothetical protein
MLPALTKQWAPMSELRQRALQPLCRSLSARASRGAAAAAPLPALGDAPREVRKRGVHAAVLQRGECGGVARQLQQVLPGFGGGRVVHGVGTPGFACPPA